MVRKQRVLGDRQADRALDVAWTLPPRGVGDVGKLEVVDRGPLEFPLLGRRSGQLDHPVEGVLEGLGVLEGDAQQHAAGCLP